MQERRFATPQDVRLRLNETYVKYKNDYFFAVQDPADNTTALLLFGIVGNNHLMTIDANDPGLDVSSPPLGYVQYPTWEGCIFISRLPLRRQNQAVRGDSVVTYNVWTGLQVPTSRNHLRQEGFLHNLQGNFPSYNGVVTSIVKNKDRTVARAFDRCFCVLYDGAKAILQYNCTNIGSIDLESRAVTLSSEHNHSVFTMRLAELGVPVAD